MEKWEDGNKEAIINVNGGLLVAMQMFTTDS